MLYSIIVDTKVRHVLTILAVRDLSRSVAFYLEAFGWEQIVTVPVYVEFLVGNGIRLGLYERTGFGRNIGREPAQIPSGTVGPTELYFYADDLISAIDQLKDAGAIELSPLSQRNWGDEAAYFADPDGNVIVLARPTASPR